MMAQGRASDPAHDRLSSVAGLSVEAQFRLRRIRMHDIDQLFEKPKTAGNDRNAGSDQHAIISLRPPMGPYRSPSRLESGLLVPIWSRNGFVTGSGALPSMLY